MALLEVIGGLLLLVFAGDGLVRGAVALATKFGVPTLIISLTIIAFGTSAPELVVGVDAVLAGSPTLALGNVIGSNIANVLLVIGLPAIILPVSCTAPRLGRNFMIMFGATLLTIGVSLDGVLTFFNAILLVSCLLGFLAYSASRAVKHRQESSPGLPDSRDAVPALDEGDELCIDEDDIPPVQNTWLAGLFLVGGLIGLAIGADLLVTGSVTIARDLDVPDEIIGLTLVAIGTSLPELVTALAAAWRGHSDVAMGSVIGSNIFNLLGILGISGMVGSIPVPSAVLSVDFMVMAATSLFLLPFILRQASLTRPVGLAMVASYCVYLILIM